MSLNRNDPLRRALVVPSTNIILGITGGTVLGTADGDSLSANNGIIFNIRDYHGFGAR